MAIPDYETVMLIPGARKSDSSAQPSPSCRRRSASTTSPAACSKVVDADPGLRSGQALRRHDDVGTVRVSIFRAPGINLLRLSADGPISMRDASTNLGRESIELRELVFFDR
jgi:hypothetical protein